MQGEVVVLYLSEPINDLPINAKLHIKYHDVTRVDEECGYVVRVNDIDNGNSVEVQYIVTTAEGHEFIVPKSYIKSIQFATEDQEMMYTLEFNQLVYNDEVDSLAKLMVSRITKWVSDGLTPDVCDDVLDDVIEKVKKKIKQQG